MNLYDTAAFNPDIQSLPSFFETPQFTQDYTEAGNIGGTYPSTNGGSYKKQGLSSDVRHTLASSVAKDAFIDYISQFGFDPTGKIANLYGNIGITGATAIQEIPDVWNIGQFALDRGDYGAITSGEFLNQPWEDVKANLNAWNIPYDSTEEEKLKQIPTLQAYRRDKIENQQGIAQTEMQRKIQEAQTHAARQRSTPGYGSAPGGQGFDAGTGRTTTSGYSGITGQKEMMADGGLAYLLYGGLV